MTNTVSPKTAVDGVRFYLMSINMVSGYVWFGGSIDTRESSPLYPSPYYTDVVPYRDMVAGKKLTPSDVVMAIRDIPYVSGVVYDMYDDQDPTLGSSDFYVLVKSGSFRHCFKCLDNNNRQPSTVAPSVLDLDEGDQVYQTSDGYRWFYEYSVPESTADDFYYDGYVPLTVNTDVTEAAVPGTINVIKVDDPGLGYDNYLTGTFTSSDLRVGGNSQVYSVASNNHASTANGFYTGDVFYVTTGSASDQWRTVRDYYANSSGRYVVLDSPFTTPPTSTASWRMDPQVTIKGTGSETVTASARALVNTSGNSIYRVEMLEIGRDYRYATATVVANASVAIDKAATVRPINSPPGGHGFDVPSELYCSADLVSVKVSGTEGDTIPGGGTFGQFGIVTQPSFANVSLTLSSSNGSFLTGDSILGFSKRRMEDSLTVSYGSDSLTGSNTHLDEQFSANDWIYVVSSDDQSHHLDRVKAVTNSTHITLSSNVLFSCTDVIAYAANVVDTGVVTGTTGSTIHVSNTPMNFVNGLTVSTYPNGGWGVVDTVASGGVSKNNYTYDQTLRITGQYVEGSYSEGEFVYQGDSASNPTSSAYVFSQDTDGSNTTLYLTRTTGRFNDTRLKGKDSGVIFNIQDKYQPELVPGSGNVLYVQNIDPVARVSNQAIRLNFLIKFF